MAEPKNLIALKQLRQSELSGFVNTLITGYTIGYVSGASGSLYSYIQSVSGALQSQIDLLESSGAAVMSFRAPIASGVDIINCLYSATVGSLISVGQIGTSGATDPIILGMLTDTNYTGSVVELSAPTPSPNYYLNLLVPV